MELDTIIDTKSDHDREGTHHCHIKLDSGKPHETHGGCQANADEKYREETVSGIGKQDAHDNNHQYHRGAYKHTD